MRVFLHVHESNLSISADNNSGYTHLLSVRLFQNTDCTVKFKWLKTKRLVCFDIFVFDFELDAYPNAYLKLAYN